MRSVQDQLAAVLAGVGPVPPLEVALHDAVGCVLAADVAAQADMPLHPPATGDGYAVASAETAAAGGDLPVTLPVAHDVHAGEGAPLGLAPGQAVRIASGGPVPIGADAVVPLEDTDRGAARVTLTRPARPGQHVRRPGVDTDRDTVQDVLAPLGTVRSDHVAMSSGRRQGFGTVGGLDDDSGAVPIFALPGHPVAAHVSSELLVRPALRANALAVVPEDDTAVRPGDHVHCIVLEG